MSTVENWSKEAEETACRESKSATAGAPFYVALEGKVECVTRRCAEELIKHRQVFGCISARDKAGNGGISMKTLKAAAHGQNVGLTFHLQSLGDKTWMLHCPEMHCYFPTKNPGREMIIICDEFTTLLEEAAQ